MLRNSQNNYGVISKLFHWSTALLFFGLFALGWWMVDLTYYSEWYQPAPDYHESFGLLLILMTGLRLIWRFTESQPVPIPSQQLWEKRLAKIVKWSLWGLLVALLASGFLISTADFRSVDFFGLVSIPPLFSAFEDQAEIAGLIHRWLAYVMIAIVGLHAAGAIKHQFIDKDGTLSRML